MSRSGSIFLIAVLEAAFARAQDAPAPADLVLQHGTVYTVDATDRVVQALAITGNRITAVGSDADVARTIGPATKVIDLQGQAVYPGFYESHGHLIGVGQLAMTLDLTGTTSFAEVVEKVKTAPSVAPETFGTSMQYQEQLLAAVAGGSDTSRPPTAIAATVVAASARRKTLFMMVSPRSWAGALAP